MTTPSVIIIAEPDPIFGSVLRVEFESIGFTVMRAGSGPEAEAFADSAAAELVLVDTALPHLSGLEACARIRRETQSRRAPIVLTTSRAGPKLEAAASVAGVTLTLAKPYAFGDLIHALEKKLDAGHPVLSARPRTPGVAESKRIMWGPLPPLSWRFGADSGLSRNAGVLPIVRQPGMRIPLRRKP